MQTRSFTAAVEGGALHGTISDGTSGGAQVLVLHGGPGLEVEYLDPLLAELHAGGHTVATYQQRGLAPSTTSGPFDVPTQVRDVGAVLDALGWDRPVVVGHSWGGHLLLHVLATMPDRLRAALVVDPLGAVGDGGLEGFGAALLSRVPTEDAARWQELEEAWNAGAGTEQIAIEQLRLIWPGYFAATDDVLPPAVTRVGVETSEGTWASLVEELPGLAARLAGCPTPTTVVHGLAGPVPLDASRATADALGEQAVLNVVDGAGHFIWHEAPGACLAALEALLARA